MPRPPDAGFFGRDETLLALDRAFDDQRVVLLHAFAGAGKSSTAAEFARWYQATGGLDHPDTWAPGRCCGPPSSITSPWTGCWAPWGTAFAALLEANGIHWQAVTDPGQRRHLVRQLLAQVPVLWVWDNVEPVTGFPAGAASAWTQDEQDELTAFLRDVAQQTQCQVLLTSRRDEQAWLGGLPARVRLPRMPMRERLQLAAALAARHGQADPGIDWRPLLRFSAGNPLAITVLAGQALREGLASTADMERVRGPAAGRGGGAGGGGGRGAGPHPVPGRLLVLWVQPTPSPTLSAPSWPCCTCSATPSTLTPSRAWATPSCQGRRRPRTGRADPRHRHRAAGPRRRHRPAHLPRRRVLPDPPRPALVLHHPVRHRLRPAQPARPPSEPPTPTPTPSPASATTTTPAGWQRR